MQRRHTHTHASCRRSHCAFLPFELPASEAEALWRQHAPIAAAVRDGTLDRHGVRDGALSATDAHGSAR